MIFLRRNSNLRRCTEKQQVQEIRLISWKMRLQLLKTKETSCKRNLIWSWNNHSSRKRMIKTIYKSLLLSNSKSISKRLNWRSQEQTSWSTRRSTKSWAMRWTDWTKTSNSTMKSWRKWTLTTTLTALQSTRYKANCSKKTQRCLDKSWRTWVTMEMSLNGKRMTYSTG